MFESEYFRTTLQRDVDAMGGSAVVELMLVSGRGHHLRSVVSVQSGYVTLEVYRPSVDRPLAEPRWKDDSKPAGAAHELQRAVVAYESIAAVGITAVRPASAPRIGFGGG